MSDTPETDAYFKTRLNYWQEDADFAGRLESQKGELREVLGEAARILEETYGHGVDNGYWPDIAPVLQRVRKALEPKGQS